MNRLMALGILVLLGEGVALAAPATPAGARSPAEIESAAVAQPRRFSVSLGAGSVRHLDDSYRVLGESDEQGAVSLEVSYELRRAGEDQGLALGLGVVADQVGPSEDSGHQRAKLRAVSYYALAALGFRRERTVQPFLALAAGLTRADLTVERPGSLPMRGRDHGAFGRASGGIRLAPSWAMYRNRRKQPVFGVHLSLEGGVLLGSRLTFDIEPDGSPAAAGPAIPVQSVPAGDVMPTALFAGLGLAVSF